MNPPIPWLIEKEIPQATPEDGADMEEAKALSLG